jgi:hypothetical protein
VLGIGERLARQLEEHTLVLGSNPHFAHGPVYPMTR